MIEEAQTDRTLEEVIQSYVKALNEESKRTHVKDVLNLLANSNINRIEDVIRILDENTKQDYEKQKIS